MTQDGQRALTVRFDAASHELIRAEADHAGISVAQFIREAAIIRAMIRASAREAPGLASDWVALAREVERLARVRRTRGQST